MKEAKKDTRPVFINKTCVADLPIAVIADFLSTTTETKIFQGSLNPISPSMLLSKICFLSRPWQVMTKTHLSLPKRPWIVSSMKFY